MAVNYLSTNDPKKAAQNNRDLIQQRGDQLNQQNLDLANQAESEASGYRGFLNPIEQQMALGEGGYTPEEAAAIQDKEGLAALPTSQEQLKSNFLTDEEQSGIKGDTGSYSQYFNPDLMNQNLTVAQGKQAQAVDDLQAGLKGAINPDRLRQSGAYQQDSENQLGANQSQFGTVLGAVGNNVRGAIDPTALKQDSSAAKSETMSPEEQERMVAAAGISAGERNAAAVGALQRQALAAGASPMGVAAYRARMNQQTAAEAGDAMTQARVAAQKARAEEALSSEQQRLQAQQNLTVTQVGAEQQLGSEALSGTEQLGQQALAQRNTVEQQREAAEQYLTGADLQAATTGGEAQLQNAQTSTTQGQQQAQYSANTGTAIAEAKDQANSGRAATVATNRQSTGMANQGTAFNQGNTVSQEKSQRAGTVADKRVAQQNVGLGLQAGQEAQSNSNAQGAYGRQQQGYATQTGGVNQATGTAQSASQNPSTFDKLVGGLSGAAAAFLDDGGIATEPTLAVVGEHGPEKIVQLGSPYRARMPQAAAAKPKRIGRRVYGEVA